MCEGVICGRGVREARLDINLLFSVHKCPIKNITDITDITQLLLRRSLHATHYRLVVPGLTGGCPITNLVTKSSITMWSGITNFCLDHGRVIQKL